MARVVRRPIPGLLASILLFVSACSTSSLSGSIGDSMSLGFEYIHIKKQQKFLVVEYLRNSTRGEEKVCKLSINLEDQDVPNGGSLTIEDEFLSVVELQRATFEADHFPPMASGNVKFNEIEFRDGGSVDGSFLVVFEEQTTLRGRFEGTVEEIE